MSGSPEDEFVEQVSLKLFVYLPKLHFTINLPVSVYFDIMPSKPFYISSQFPFMDSLFINC